MNTIWHWILVLSGVYLLIGLGLFVYAYVNSNGTVSLFNFSNIWTYVFVWPSVLTNRTGVSA